MRMRAAMQRGSGWTARKGTVGLQTLALPEQGAGQVRLVQWSVGLLISCPMGTFYLGFDIPVSLRGDNDDLHYLVFRISFFCRSRLHCGMVRICLEALLDSLASICNVLEHRLC